MHPPELARAAQVLDFRGVYLPFWTFGSQVNAHWRAEVGYEHKTRRYNHSTKR